MYAHCTFTSFEFLQSFEKTSLFYQKYNIEQFNIISIDKYDNLNYVYYREYFTH